MSFWLSIFILISPMILWDVSIARLSVDSINLLALINIHESLLLDFLLRHDQLGSHQVLSLWQYYNNKLNIILIIMTYKGFHINYSLSCWPIFLSPDKISRLSSKSSIATYYSFSPADCSTNLKQNNLVFLHKRFLLSTTHFLFRGLLVITHCFLRIFAWDWFFLTGYLWFIANYR